MSRETYLEKLKKCTKSKYSELRSCVVESCHNSSITTPHKIFVRVPQDLSRREKWLNAIGRIDTTDLTTFCCEDHFDLPNDMENWVKFSMTGCKICMKKDIVPYKLLGKCKTKHLISPAKRKVTFLPKLVKKQRRKSPVRKFVKFVGYDSRRKPGVSILKKAKEPKSEDQETVEKVEVKMEEKVQLKQSIHFECIKLEPLDIKEEKTPPTFELVQNYTNEYFLVPLSEKNEQSDTKLEVEKQEPSETVDNIKKVNTINDKAEPKGRKRKIYSPPDENEILEMEEFVKKRNKGIKKTEEVICNEKYHMVDIFTIFGKSVADQLRSFPVDKAVSLQSKIQDLITQERLTFFRDDIYFRLDSSFKFCKKIKNKLNMF